MSLAHHLLTYSSLRNYKRFKQALKKPLEAQKEVFKRLVTNGAISSPNAFKEVAPREYSFYRDAIAEARKDKSRYFEPTSGSTESIKWIPYPKEFKEELDRAAGPWLRDLYLTYPGLIKGPHYWSLSWLPDELRKERENQDTNALPWYKALLLNSLMVTDKSIERLPTSKLFMMTSLLKILEKKASLISVWSPTFLLRLLEILEEERDWLIDELKKTDASMAQTLKEMKGLEAESLSVLFPRLALISAWDSGTSRFWAQKIKELFPHVPFQGKGLWATEGVVTIPFEGHYPLAINSHYYEFWSPEEEQIVSLSSLEKGMVVQPLLTTGSGFERYHLKDNLEVTEFLERTPCFRFLGRSRHIDLAGEKISFEEASQILEKLSENSNQMIKPICLIAHENFEGRTYKALFQGEGLTEGQKTSLAHLLEKHLSESYHYKLARELGQLKAAQVILRNDALSFYYEACGRKIVGEGNIKPEPLIHFKELS